MRVMVNIGHQAHFPLSCSPGRAGEGAEQAGALGLSAEGAKG